ncbi:hypothetical protein VIH_001043 [Vibrio cholerae CT 5369-93]|nr:hypothetical protein VIH_001043 [Vibrio cholerae CT 5369-93]
MNFIGGNTLMLSLLKDILIWTNWFFTNVDYFVFTSIFSNFKY